MRHQVARPPPRLGLGFFVELADTPRQLVPYHLLGPGQHLRLGVCDRQAGDALELVELSLSRRLQLLLELLDMHLAVRDALLAPFEFALAAFELCLPRPGALTRLNHLS